MTDYNNPYVRWYEYHREDYSQVKNRLAACRNVMLRGRMDSAADMLRKSCVNAVLSIQTERVRHERAFSMHYVGDRSLKTACLETVYGGQKYDWLSYSLTNVNFEKIVATLRESGHDAALPRLEDKFKGLGYVKASFALAMVGVWELACPDTRTRQALGDEPSNEIRTSDEYAEWLNRIDEAVPIDEPLFIKQWILYCHFGGEHADHMPFFAEALPGLRQ